MIMSTLVVALLSFAIAFVSGALLSKAFFAAQSPAQDMIAREQHHALLKAQRSRYRKRVHALSNLLRRHEDTQAKIKEKLSAYHQAMEARAASARRADSELAKLRTNLAHLQKTVSDKDRENSELKVRITSLDADLKAEHTKSTTAANELGLLRIEREELTARVQRLEHEHRATDEVESGSTFAADEPAAEMRAEMGALREQLATRDRRVHELMVQLEDRDAQKQRVQERLETLKQRVGPLTQKLRQQRQLLRQLREVSAHLQPGDAAAQKQTDDLKAIRGIGPALERRLRSHGIERFEQIAKMSEQEFAAMATRLSIAPTLAQRQGWIQQARDLYRGLHRSD
jgi:predicted flap endonuclease-1-like 5' DNA nuclease